MSNTLDFEADVIANSRARTAAAEARIAAAEARTAAAEASSLESLRHIKESLRHIKELEDRMNRTIAQTRKDVSAIATDSIKVIEGYGDAVEFAFSAMSIVPPSSYKSSFASIADEVKRIEDAAHAQLLETAEDRGQDVRGQREDDDEPPR